MRKITNNKYNYEVNSDKTSGYSTINDHVLDEILNYEGENKIDKIPLLGDVPYLGNLFKNTLKEKRRRELLIFITPRIISNISTLN